MEPREKERELEYEKWNLRDRKLNNCYAEMEK